MTLVSSDAFLTVVLPLIPFLISGVPDDASVIFLDPLSPITCIE